VQRRIKVDKRRTWPAYVATVRARYHCPTILVVVALKEAVARWARASIELGHPGFTLRPIVISGAQIPEILDEKTARRSPHLAVLSALAHPRVRVAAAAISALDRLPEEESELYYDAVLAGLPHFDRQILEAHMQGYQYRSLFARTFIEQGRQEGRQEGKLAAIELAQAKLGRIAFEEESAILSMQDESQVTDLIVGLGRARSHREAKAVLALAVPVSG
jgi:hypothetical protein